MVKRGESAELRQPYIKAAIDKLRDRNTSEGPKLNSAAMEPWW